MIPLYQFDIFNPYVLIPVIGISLYLFIFVVIYKRSIQRPESRWFLGYIGVAILGGIASFFATISRDVYDAIFWQPLFTAIAVFCFPALIGYTLTQIHKTKLLNKIKVVMFIPSLIISLLTMFTNLIWDHNPNHAVYLHHMWYINPAPLFGPVFVLYLNIIAITCGILLTVHAFHTKDKRDKIQALLFIIGFILNTIVANTSAFVFPVILHKPIVPDGMINATVWGVFIAIGILKTNWFVIKPTTVVSNIINTMSEILIVINPEGNIEFTNPAAENVLGYAEGELVGKGLSAVLSEDSSHVQTLLIKPILVGEKQTAIEGYIYKKDGTKIPTNFSASAINQSSGVLEGIVCVATDITHIKELYNVTNQKQKLDTIMQTMVDGIVSISRQGVIKQINRAAVIMIGLSEDDILNKKVDDLIHFENESLYLSSEDIVGLTQEPKRSSVKQPLELKFLSRGGEKHTVQLTVMPLNYENTQEGEILLVFHDISEEHELERMKLDFVSIAAHELRTPLTALKGYLSLLEEDKELHLNEEQKKFFRGSALSAERLASLVQNLLNVSRIEQGKLKVDKIPVDIQTLAQSVLDELQQESSQHNIHLSLELPTDTLPKISADEFRIGEVITNLVSNAIDYNNPGGFVKISIEKRNSDIVVSVTDNGHGIPSASLPHLFSKFYRVSTPLEMGSKGTGLGLFISKSIIDAHQGKIWVESEEGKGSTFRFSLPLTS